MKMSVNFSLEGKTALVTGASYGIGFAIASGMAKAGATIVFNDIKQELVDKGIAAYKEAGIEAHGYVCDVTNEDAVNEMVAKIAKEVAPIDILVNNAGIIKRIPMCDMTAAEFRQVINVDLNAPFIVSKADVANFSEARLSFAVCSAFRSRLLVRAEDRPVRALSLIRSLGRGVFIRSFSRQGKHRKESFVGTIAFARLRAAGFVTGRSVVTVRFRDSYSIGKQPAGCRRNNPVVWQRRSECETDFPTPV